MPNRTRFNLPGIPQHLVQRGNDRQCCFRDQDDFQDYLRRLRRCSQRHAVAIHAYVLMPNHVHLLATPGEENSVSRMMQCVGATYVRSFNSKYRRTGTLWDSRYHACLVDSSEYFWNCHKYIELNPVRAMLVAGPAEYEWSSHRRNALGLLDPTVTPHPSYLSLGLGERQCARTYAGFFACSQPISELESIRDHLRQERALGAPEFQARVEMLSGRGATCRGRGRPRTHAVANEEN